MGSQSLQSARQSLLVYSTLYPYLYGPRGAGPAHLPCPDNGGTEGPDPPCGNSTVASGALPRHVSLPGQRYPFTADVSADYRYRVASELINNPVNRTVNDEILEELTLSNPYPVWVDSGAAHERSVRVPLSSRAMIPGLRAVVRAWLVARLKRKHDAECLEPSALAPSSSQATSHWLVMIADEPLHPLDEQADCTGAIATESLLQNLQIEGVPALSHWFIRNRWHERVAFSGQDFSLSDPQVIFR
ncbi:hypothetical protein ACUNV4_12880 [Granulosicoccus sp. 3-233]|uniref:hypothetical protein n=1 Tax=Granulosicoccus sp. 3-233 TaxID=3417969 RepID=UPI003D3269BB